MALHSLQCTGNLSQLSKCLSIWKSAYCFWQWAHCTILHGHCLALCASRSFRIMVTLQSGHGITLKGQTLQCRSFNLSSSAHSQSSLPHLTTRLKISLCFSLFGNKSFSRSTAFRSTGQKPFWPFSSTLRKCSSIHPQQKWWPQLVIIGSFIGNWHIPHSKPSFTGSTNSSS